MDQGLISAKGSRSSIETIWKRYITILRAITRVGELEWAVGKKPTDSEVIGVYGGKSTFYEQEFFNVSNFIPTWLSGWRDLIWMGIMGMKLTTFGVITKCHILLRTWRSGLMGSRGELIGRKGRR